MSLKLTSGVERFLVVDEEDFKLFHGDSFKIIPNIHKQFELIFVDPPFFGWASGSKGDQKPEHNTLSYEIYRRQAQFGCMWLCGTQPQLAMDWKWWARFYTFMFEMIQSKDAGPPPINRKQPRRVHENIWCMRRTKDKFSDLKITTDRVTRKGTTKTVIGQPMKIWGIATKSTWRTGVGVPKSVYRSKRISKGHPEYVGHPTQKPEELIELIIKMSTEEGDWILDPFSGSGVVPKVARRFKRNCVAVEIEDKWIPVIEKQLQVEATRTQLTDFVEAEL